MTSDKAHDPNCQLGLKMQVWLESQAFIEMLKPVRQAAAVSEAIIPPLGKSSPEKYNLKG